MKITALFLVFLLAIIGVNAVTECDYSSEIILESNEFAVKDFKFKVKAAKLEGPSTNITGRISIKDEYGNEIKSYKPWTNASISKQKTSSGYSPNLKEGFYEITAEIDALCDDFGKENNIAKRKITIKQIIPENTAAKNEIAIVKPEENEDQILFSNYNTESNQTALIQPASTEENENSQTFSDSNNKSGEIAAMQSSADEENKVYAENQETAKEETANSGLQENQVYAEKNTINQQLKENQPTGNVIYESSSEKSKKFMVYMLLGISIILNIVLIWRRNLGMP